jgi:RNA polymerase sigma factor (sigma-70 family)
MSVIETNRLTRPASGLATIPRRKLQGRRLDDEQLASRVADGNELAFTALYERYHQPLYRYCRSLLHNDADAQDALQSTFTSALVALQGNRRDAPLRPWLFRIAHNEAISLIRRRRVGEQELSESSLPPVQSAADQAGERARLALLVADLNHLPDRQRGALVMRELSGLSHAEIALALDTSPAAAKQAIFEARAALAEFAEGRAAPCEEIRRRLSEHDGRVLRNRRLRSHLRDCSSCDAFATRIGQRRSDLRAVAPALPVAASVGLLARIGRAGGDQGLSGLAAGGVAAGAAGKFGGAALISKGLAAIAAALTTVAGVAGLGFPPHPSGHASAPAVRVQVPGAPHASPPAAPVKSGSSQRQPRGATHPARTRPAVHSANPSTTAHPIANAPASPSARVVVDKRSAKPNQSSTSTQRKRPGVTRTTSSTSFAPASETVSASGNSSAPPGPPGTSPGRSSSSNGNSTAAPGHTGTATGNEAVPPGRSATPPGWGATPPGQAIAPGKSAAAPGKNAPAPGKSGSAPGHGSTPPGQAKR